MFTVAAPMLQHKDHSLDWQRQSGLGERRTVGEAVRFLNIVRLVIERRHEAPLQLQRHQII